MLIYSDISIQVYDEKNYWSTFFDEMHEFHLIVTDLNSHKVCWTFSIGMTIFLPTGAVLVGIWK